MLISFQQAIAIGNWWILIYQVERNNDYSDIDFASRLCTRVPAHPSRDNLGCFLTAGFGVSHFKRIGRSSQKVLTLAVVDLR
jgi:hypothetical protein